MKTAIKLFFVDDDVDEVVAVDAVVADDDEVVLVDVVDG